MENKAKDLLKMCEADENKQSYILLVGITKSIEEDSFEGGAIPGTNRIVIDDSPNKKFKYFVDLLEYLNAQYDLPKDPKEYMAFEDGRIDYQTQEDHNGDKLEKGDDNYIAWKNGKGRAFIADYSMYIKIVQEEFTPDTEWMVKQWGVQQY